MKKMMIPILCEWELPAHESTCQANHHGIPESWYDSSRQPTPGALTRDPRLIFLRRPKEEPSQQRWLPRHPEGPVLAPSDTLVVYEIEVQDLAPGEVDLLQFCLFHIIRVRHRPTNVKLRQRAIERLHHDTRLAILVAQKVLGGVPVSALLEPKQLGRLFAHSVGERTLERDVAHVRKHASTRTRHETTLDQNDLVANTSLHEPVEKQVTDGAGVQPKDFTHTPRSNDTESIQPKKPAGPELDAENINRAGAAEEGSLDDTGHSGMQDGALPEHMQGADTAAAQLKKVTRTPHSSDTDSIQPEKLSDPEISDQTINCADGSGEMDVDDAGESQTDTNRLPGPDDAAGTAKAETSALSRAEASSDATPSQPEPSQTKAADELGSSREQSQEDTEHERVQTTDSPPVPRESHHESEAETADALEMDTQAQELTSHPEGLTPSPRLESNTLSRREKSSSGEAPANSSAEQTSDPEQPTEEFVAQVVGMIRQDVRELPPAEELLATIREREGEATAKKIVQWLADRKEAVQDPKRRLKIGMGLLKRLRELEGASGSSTEEASQ